MVGVDELGHVAEPRRRRGPAVLLIHSWWGMTSSFRSLADELAARGHLVGCADLFDGATATTEAEADALRSARRREPRYRVLRRCLAELSAHPRAGGQDPAVIGFSMGGHWAVWLAQHPPPTLSGVVLFYAARGGDFGAATAPMMTHFATDDPFVTDTARRRMQRAVTRRGLVHESYDYAGTGHWFAERDHANHDAEATDLALERTSAFLARLGS